MGFGDCVEEESSDATSPRRTPRRTPGISFHSYYYINSINKQDITSNEAFHDDGGVFSIRLKLFIHFPFTN